MLMALRCAALSSAFCSCVLAIAVTAQTVRPVADLLPAPGLGSMDRTGRVSPGLRPGEVFLVLDDGVPGTELWRGDGTAAGTSLVLSAAAVRRNNHRFALARPADHRARCIPPAERSG